MNASLAHSYRVLTAEQDVTRTLEAVQVDSGLECLMGKRTQIIRPFKSQMLKFQVNQEQSI